MIRIAMADDHPMIRRGFRAVIGEQPDMEIVAEAANGDELFDQIPPSRPNVVLLDVAMPGPGFLANLRELKENWPQIKILVVSVHAEEQYAVRSLRAGAAGYLCKTRSGDELVAAIRRVHGGRRYLTSAMTERLTDQVAGASPTDPHEALSEREFEVLVMIASGKSLKEIGADLDVSPKTVSIYWARILAKLGVDTTAALIRYALEGGLVDDRPVGPERA